MAVPPGLIFLTLALCASTGPTHAGRMKAPSGLRVEPPEFPMQLRLRWDPPDNATALDSGGGGGLKYALQIFSYSSGRRKELECVMLPSTSYTDELFSAGARVRARVGIVARDAASCSNSSQRRSNWSQLVDIFSERGLAGSAASDVHCALLTGAANTMECSWVRGPNASADTNYSLYYWHNTLNGTRRCVPCTHERLSSSSAAEHCHQAGRPADHAKKTARRKHRKTPAGVTFRARASAPLATVLPAGAAGPGGGGGAGERGWQRCCVPAADVRKYCSFRIVVNGTSARHDVTPLYRPLPVENLEKPDPPAALRVGVAGSSVLLEWDPTAGRRGNHAGCYQTDMRVHDGQRDCQQVSEPSASWPQPGDDGCPVTFRVRARPCTRSGGLWSEWSREAHHPVGTATNCTDGRSDVNTTDPRVRLFQGDQGPRPFAWFLASGLVALGVVVLVAVFVFKSGRLRRWFVPWVPDPSRYFKNLFDVHGGDFQAWAGFRASGKPAAPAVAGAGGDADETSPAPVYVLSEAVALTVTGGIGGTIGGTIGYLNLETLCTETALLWQHG